MWCWGYKLANGQETNTSVPTEVGGGRTFVALSAGWSHACGLDTSGNVWCFGAYWGSWTALLVADILLAQNLEVIFANIQQICQNAPTGL